MGCELYATFIIYLASFVIQFFCKVDTHFRLDTVNC